MMGVATHQSSQLERGTFSASLPQIHRRAFPPDDGSLLPGSLATTRTGLTPAGDDELQTESGHVFIVVTPPARWAYSRIPWNFGGGPVIIRRR